MFKKFYLGLFLLGFVFFQLSPPLIYAGGSTYRKPSPLIKSVLEKYRRIDSDKNSSKDEELDERGKFPKKKTPSNSGDFPAEEKSTADTLQTLEHEASGDENSLKKKSIEDASDRDISSTEEAPSFDPSKFLRKDKTDTEEIPVKTEPAEDAPSKAGDERKGIAGDSDEEEDLVPTNEDSTSDDPFAESENSTSDDPFAEDNEDSASDDPFAEDKDSEGLFEYEDSGKSDIRLDIKQMFLMQMGAYRRDKGYKENVDDHPITEKRIFINEYNFQMVLQSSATTRYNLDLSIKIDVERDIENDNADEEIFSFDTNEAYVDYNKGRHFFRIGQQKIYFLLPLAENLDSPFDFFNMPKQKPFTIRYLWSPSINNSFYLYYSPIYLRSEAEKETITRGEQNEAITDELGEITTREHPIRDHYGGVYKFSLDLADIKVGFFRWADTNAYTIASQTSYVTSPEPHSDYESSLEIDSTDIFFQKEAETVTIKLAGAGVALGSFDFKIDIAHFDKKTFYHVFKTENSVVTELPDPDNPTENITYTTTSSTLEQMPYRLPYTVLNMSLEKHWKYAYLMIMYTHKKIQDAPPNTNIYLFENEETPKSNKRDLHKNEYIIGLASDFSEQIELILNYYRSNPFRIEILNFSALWKPLNSDMHYTFAFKHLETEELKATGQPTSETRAFAGLIYKF